MLVKMGKILIETRKKGYGVVAVSCFSLELIKVAISAVEKKCSPVTPNTNLKYDFVREEQDVELLLYMARQRAMRFAVSVTINLDHGQNYQTVMHAISHDFTFVMVGASSRPYEENVTVTKEVVHAAHSIGLPVEAELGCVGMADETLVLEDKYTKNAKTDPAMMKDFVEKIDMGFLIISVGNARGLYARSITPRIDFDLLEEIAAAIPIPLALHGGGGTGDENLSKACRMGISKINVGADLTEMAIRKASQCYQEDPDMGRIDFLTNCISGYQEGIGYYMDVFGSTGKAIPSVTSKTECSHPKS